MKDTVGALAPKDERADKYYSVAELAKELGVTTRTLRFYEDRGLVTPQRAGTARIYSRRDRARMIIVLRGKRLGFSLREIKEYLDLYDHDRTHTGQLHVLAEAVTERIGLLEKQRQALEETLAELHKLHAETVQAISDRSKSGVRA